MTLKSVLISSVALLGLAAAGGASAYSSDYVQAFTAGDLQPEGTYANLANPYIIRTDGAWGSYLAPSGTGTFEVVNGAGDPTMRFYYDTVNLVAGTPYLIGADMVDNYSISAPVIQLMVDGANVGPSQTLTGPYGQYQNADNSAPPVPGSLARLRLLICADRHRPSYDRLRRPEHRCERQRFLLRSHVVGRGSRACGLSLDGHRSLRHGRRASQPPRHHRHRGLGSATAPIGGGSGVGHR